ncbi:FMN-binding protein [Gemmatimonadota bacterium]
MSDETRKSSGPPEDQPGKVDLPDREEVMPRDHQLYTPQGGGAGTGSGPIGEVAAVRDDSTDPVARGAEGLVLPQVGPVQAAAEGPGVGLEGDGSGVGGVPQRPEASSFRLLMTLGVAGAIAGALLVFVFLWSEPIIQAENARVLREAVTEVLKGPDHFESVFLLDGELTTEVPAGVDTLGLDKVFLGYDEDGNPLGFALAAEGFGFQDIISLIFGYDAGTGQLLGMKVLRHLETPGLGDKIQKDMDFVGGFDGVETPIEGRKPDRFTGDPGQVETITGVTISSVAVIRIINERIAELGDLLAAYESGGGGPAGAPAGGEEDGQ